MSYGLIYTVPFASLHNEACVVEIEKEGYTGPSTELQAAGTPFTVEIGDEEFLYTPTRFSTATIRVVGSDYLQSLFSTAYQQYRVTFKKDGVITWCGFIKPELYTQDYSSEIFELELEAISAMSTLEYIDYKQSGEESRVFVSIWDLLKKCVTSANSLYDAVYIPHVYGTTATTYEAGENVLEAMTLSEQDFFDEDDKPMALKEVLEEICKFLNWTCVDWQGSLYFVDVDHTGEYYKYSPDLERKIGTASPSLMEIWNVGHAGSEHSLDILPGYNKVTVQTSNYPVGTIFPEEDFDKLKIIKKCTKTDSSDPAWPDRVESTYIFLSPDVYTTKHYGVNQWLDTPIFEVPESYYGDLPDAEKLTFLGASLMKSCNIKFNDGVPEATSYDFEDLIHLCVTRTDISLTGNTYWILPIDTDLLKVGRSLPCACYLDGAISINMSIKTDSMARQDITMDKEFNFQPVRMYFRLKIGESYYNGSKWTGEPSVFPVEFENQNRAYEQYNYIRVKNTKTLDMPYNGMEGYIIPIENVTLTGSPELTVVGFFARGSGAYDTSAYQYGCYIKDIKIVYQKRDENVWAETDNSDRIYENVVNEDYINELDEIEFKVSSYNDDGTCYSKVMLGSAYLTDNLYSSVEGTAVRPEEHLIRRIIKRYGVTRIKLTQVIKEPPVLKPFDRLSDSFLVSKRFINAGGSIDYKMNRFECIMIEV